MTEKTEKLTCLLVGDLVVHPESAHYLICSNAKLRPKQSIFTEKGMIGLCSDVAVAIWVWRIADQEWEYYPGAIVEIFKDTYVMRDGVKYIAK